LHRDPTVVFAGYRMPHPLDHSISVKIQTNGASTPQNAFVGTLAALTYEMNSLEEQFKVEREVQKQEEKLALKIFFHCRMKYKKDNRPTKSISKHSHWQAWS
jgi:hypothetical protein